jgi:opacity protein-like surface antigen
MRSRVWGMVGIVAIAACLPGLALADELVGAYIGGGVGQGRVEAGTAGLLSSVGSPVGNFDRTHAAYHLDFGIRPTGASLALELEYLDLGEPHAPPYAGPGFLYGRVSQRGAGLFLLYYLPIPIVQIYGKAGGSRITTHENFTYCAVDACQPIGRDPTNDAFAFGAGLQWTLGRWAVRGEYERFNAGGGRPSLITIGVDWTFL